MSIFADLDRLYQQGEHVNEKLRNAMKAKINARISRIRTLENIAVTKRRQLADSTNIVYNCEQDLKRIADRIASMAPPGDIFTAVGVYNLAVSQISSEFTSILH